MAKFIVVGVFQDVQMHLTLPAAKHFEVHTVNDDESELQVDHIINKAVCSERWDSTTHTRPFIFRDDQSCKPEELQKPFSIYFASIRIHYPRVQSSFLWIVLPRRKGQLES